MSDEHNPRYASPWGHPFIETRAMQQLADRGTVFRNAYCPSPLCVPSRSAFLSGKRVHQVQAYGNNRLGIPAEPHGLGSVLSESGVHSVFIGKTHAYRPVTELGFSEVILAHGDADHGFDLAQERDPLAVRTGAASRADQYGPRDTPWGNDVAYADAAVDWLRNRAPKMTRPWVMYINLLKPHFPHFCNQDLWDRYEGRDDLPSFGADTETGQHLYSQDLRQHFELEDMPEVHVRGQRRGYYACVSFIDQQLARIMTALDNSRQAGNTNLIYTSDHGEMLGKFGLWWKCTLLEDAARIPIIAAGPDFGAGVTETPVDLHDVQASVFAATGATQPAGWLGSPLQSAAKATDRVVFAEYHGHGTRAGSFMMRRGDWKLIHNIAAPDQLFNLADDPEELHNLHRAAPASVGDLRAELVKICDPAAEHQRAEAFWRAQLRQNAGH